MQMDSNSLVQMELEAEVIPPPRHKFVNTMRGSCFSEISFDDLPLDFEPHKCKLDDQRHDKGGSKIVDEVVPVEIINNKDTYKEVKCDTRSGFDTSKYTELQNSEELIFEKWLEQKLIISGGLLLCGNVFSM